MPKLLIDKDTEVIHSMIKHQCQIHVADGKNLLTSLYELQLYNNWSLLCLSLIESGSQLNLTKNDYMVMLKA